MDYNNSLQEGEDVARAAQDRSLVSFRDREIDLVVAILARKRSVLLVGPAGVGKSAVVDGVALRLARETGGHPPTQHNSDHLRHPLYRGGAKASSLLSCQQFLVYIQVLIELITRGYLALGKFRTHHKAEPGNAQPPQQRFALSRSGSKQTHSLHRSQSPQEARRCVCCRLDLAPATLRLPRPSARTGARLSPTLPTIDHRPSATFLGPRCANRARSLAIFSKKLFFAAPLIWSAPSSDVRISHPAVGWMCASYG
ncbi:MAG TPA: hypothetical protein VGJ20_07655 [Xanthobacteraceae bacterium]|jgi:hypothetical protein